MMAILECYRNDLQNLIGVALEAGFGAEDIKDMVDVIAGEIAEAREQADKDQEGEIEQMATERKKLPDIDFGPHDPAADKRAEELAFGSTPTSDKPAEVPVSPQSVSEMQPFYEKRWDSWQSCSDVWPKLLPWWVRRFAGEWADSRVQAALAPLRHEIETFRCPKDMLGKVRIRHVDKILELESALRDMERQRDEQREKLEATNG